MDIASRTTFLFILSNAPYFADVELKEKIEKWKREKDKKINNEGGGGNKDRSEG